MFTSVTFSAEQVWQLIIEPSLLGTSTMQNVLEDFVPMENITGSSAKIGSITGRKKLLQRYGNNCVAEFRRVADAANRIINVTPLIAQTQTCLDEYYNNCMSVAATAENKDSLIELILNFFSEGILNDIASNAWYGAVAGTVNPEWSTNEFDGIFTDIANLIASGDIVPSQTIAAPAITPATAQALLQAMIDGQTQQMKGILNSEKTFWVSQDVYEAYQTFLIQTGAAFNPLLYQTGIQNPTYLGITIKAMPMWTAIDMAGSAPNNTKCLLGLKYGNIFGTDKNYQNPYNMSNGDNALEVWYNKDEMTWKMRTFLKAGAAIVSPKHVVIAD